MVLAASYPFLEIFWTLLIFFAFVIWLSILFSVLGDLFRRHDVSGLGKVLWIILIVVMPYLGVFIYMISQHAGMTQRTIERQRAARSEIEHFVQAAAGKGDPTDQIARAKGLLDQGAIDQSEFEQIKRQALAGA